MPAKARQEFIGDKIVYSYPVKDRCTLEELDPYKPLLAFDNAEEVNKIRRHVPHAGLILRIQVPNAGYMVELSSKFGASLAEATDMIAVAADVGLVVEGIGFHVGSQCINFENYVQALSTSAAIMEEAKVRGFSMKLLHIGEGFSVWFNRHVRLFRELARILCLELNRLFPKSMEIIAEPGPFMVGTTATLVVEVIGKSERVLSVFGPTCKPLDIISQAEDLPEFKLGDLVYSQNIGAYSHGLFDLFQRISSGSGGSYQSVINRRSAAELRRNVLP